MKRTEVHFAQDVSLHLLEEGGLVLCEGTQSLYELNTTAAIIWCSLEEHPSLERATTALSRILSIEPTQALPYVDASVEEWWKACLIRGSEVGRSEPTHQPGQEMLLPQNSAHFDDIDSATIFESYRLADATFRVSFPSPKIHDLVHEALRNLQDPGPSEHQIRIEAANGSYTIGAARTALIEGIGREGLLPTLMGYFGQTALLESTYFLAVHAAALQCDRGSYLLAGGAGSGKSTLTAELVRCGHRYYSDDVTLLDAPDLTVRPFPLSICAKEGSWEVLARLYPRLNGAFTHLRWDQKHVRYLVPDRQQLATPDPVRSKVKAIIFVSYDERGTNDLQQLRKTEAARRLLRTEACHVPVRLTSGYVSRLVGWIRDVETHTLSFSQLDQAVEVIRSNTEYR